MIGIILSLVLFLLIVFPTGSYLFRVASKKKTFADPVFDKLDGGLYKLLKINQEDMTWKEYALSLILLNACLVFVGYLILRIQSIGLFNPNKIGKMEESLAFNTIVSFMTNTNLQDYAGESGLSYFSQMFVIIMMMFTSAATGFAACMAMIRGLLEKKMGNFYVDFIRVITRFFLPLSIILGLVLVGLKVPQNLSANTVLTTIEGKTQTIAQGPIVALEIIKYLRTNGGGFLGANSSTPLENPSIYTNLIEMISMMLVPGSCVIIFGKMAEERIREKKNIKKEGKTLIGKEGLAIFITMSIIFILSLIFIVKSEEEATKS